MQKEISKTGIFLRIIFSTIVFSFLIKLDSIFQLGNRLADQGWTLVQILALITVVRLVLAGVAAALFMPWILGEMGGRRGLLNFLKIDGNVVLAGLLSILLFCVTGWILSLVLGLELTKPATLFAKPDLAPDPDVIGWGYFLVALVPGIWEEIAFRGWIQSSLVKRFSPWGAVLFSAAIFSLFHLSNLVSQEPGAVISGMVMAFFFGLGWGWLTLRSRSLLPAMFSHYLVDCLGLIFLGVSSQDPKLQGIYFIALTLVYPLLTILTASLLFQNQTKEQLI